MKRFLCLVILLLAVAAAVVAASRFRERRAILPFPRPDAEEDEPAGSGEAPAPAEPDDLTEVSGIGPVYRARLAEAGVTTFAGLSAADPDTLSAAAGVPAARAADWIAQAAARAAR